jgi:hypothetical protein
VSQGDRCTVCERTILAGERTRTYISPKLGPRLVCDLCRGRAERRGWVDPAAPGADVGLRPPEPELVEDPAARLRRTIDRFNASAAAHTVAGLMRTLGEPWVSIGAAAGSPGEARVTVAWELCWYQWAVDLSEHGSAVAELDRGTEMAQLDTPARQWNARAEEAGRLALGARAPSRRRDGEPVA